jgi:hypothetical protein
MYNILLVQSPMVKTLGLLRPAIAHCVKTYLYSIYIPRE